MGLIVECPLPASLPTIPQVSCPFRFDQVVKLAFQRRQPSGTPPFPTLTAFQAKASWTTFIGATDNTKVVTSPIITGLVIPRSEGLMVGGNDNSTFAGIPEYNGEGFVGITGQIKNLPPVVYRALKRLSQESLASAVGVSNLCIMMVNRDGVMFPDNPVDNAGAATTIYRFIPVYNFRISSPGSEGFNASNINDISFQLKDDWADHIAAVKPAFDPLTEI